MPFEFTFDELSILRMALQDRIGELLSLSLITNAREACRLYLKIGGYDAYLTDTELKQLGEERG